MSFFENTRKPVGLGGKIMVAMMNLGHSPVARWGLRFLELTLDAKVLDCGCGGGANIKRLLKKCPEGIVKGIDYSPVSVEKSKKVNEVAIAEVLLYRSARQRGEYDLCRRLVRCGNGL
ncbi:MAG: methyltransferase domain-containing protein [Gallintestinimicrobium sp.]